MSKKLMKIPTTLSMTSLEVSELVQSRHDNVKVTIERLINRGVIAHPAMQDMQIKGGNNRKYKQKVYRFEGEQGRLDCITVVAQLCPEFTAALVKRWDELEKEVVVLKRQLEERKDSKQLFRHMTDTIKEVCEYENETPDGFVYAKEADLINHIIFGMKSTLLRKVRRVPPNALIRDYMTGIELEEINKLQSANSAYIEGGIEFEQRKKMLQKIHNRFISKKLVCE